MPVPSVQAEEGFAVKYFFYGAVRPDPDGHTYITTGEGYRVQGGSKSEHDLSVEITEKLQREVERHGHENFEEIARDVIREVKGKTP